MDDDLKNELLAVPDNWDELADDALECLKLAFDSRCTFEVVSRSPQETNVIVRGDNAPYSDAIEAAIRAVIRDFPVVKQLGKIDIQFIETPRHKLYTPGAIVRFQGREFQCIGFGQSDDPIDNPLFYERHPLGSG